MSDQVSLSDLRKTAESVGTNLAMLNIEVCWEDGEPQVLLQADLDRGTDEDFETILLESKAKTIDGSLLKIKSMIEGIKIAGE